MEKWQRRGGLGVSRAMRKQSDAISSRVWILKLRLPSAMWEKTNVRQIKSHQEGERPEGAWEFLQSETRTSSP